MSTDTVNHLTRKAAGKIKIINCSNMQGRCSAEQAVSASSDADLTAEKAEFRPLTFQAVGLWRIVVFVATRSYFKLKKKNPQEVGKTRESVGRSSRLTTRAQSVFLSKMIKLNLQEEKKEKQQ